MNQKLLWIVTSSTIVSIAAFLSANEPTLKDLVYATVDSYDLKLDLYLPTDVTNAPSPLVVWIHGGAWRAGSKDNPPILYLLTKGFSVASVDYRLSTQAKFPALIHDCKAAIRWLRKNPLKLPYKADKIGVMGSSAGGHIVALLGVTNRSYYHEGNIGIVDQSSDVQAVIDFYGPTNFLTILDQSTPHGLSVRVPALQMLLGCQPQDNLQIAELASPAAHVDCKDPPILILHGDQDPQVPISQSLELFHQYQLKHLDAHLEVVYGGKHGGPLFHNTENQKLVVSFLNKHIR